MLLFADSGSTKTEWMLVHENGEVIVHTRTRGLNPYYITDSDVKAAVFEVLPDGVDPLEIEHVFFYGAGCGNSERRKMMVDALEDSFTIAIVDVFTDILGAARSVWQHERGIAAILGTGANACGYNGENIFRKVLSLGYLIGDEGSGAYLGKKFLELYYKRTFDHEFVKIIRSELDMDYNNVMNSMYRSKTPSVYLASFVPFLHKYRSHRLIQNLLLDAFCEFFVSIVKSIPECCDLPVGFVGAVSSNFEAEITQAAKKNRIMIGRFISDPLSGIVQYHLSDDKTISF